MLVMLHKQHTQQQHNIQRAGAQQSGKLVHQRVIAKRTIQTKGRKAEQKQRRYQKIQLQVLVQSDIDNTARQHIKTQPESQRQHGINQ